MKKKTGLLLLVLAMAVLIGGAAVLYNALGKDLPAQQLATQPTDPPATQPAETPTEEATQPEPVMAPDFTVYNAAGEEVHLTDFAGKPVVLNFWASWCGPCTMEMPHFQQAFEELGEDVHFLMVNMTNGRETRETADAFIKDSGYTFPVYYDTQMDAATVYGAYSIPMTFFVNAQGHAIAQATGAIDLETLNMGIDMIR